MAIPLSVLILGGTGFLGAHQVRYALSRGHNVTIFNRGRRPNKLLVSVEALTGDRNTGDYRTLTNRKFDVCIDNSARVPHWVRDSAGVLKGNIGHYIFISSISVYAENEKIGSDESGAREKFTGTNAMAETVADLEKNMAMYGALKALCEDEAHKQFPGLTTVIRPALIAGSGDETDRFTYWPVRLARGGKVLVPPLADPVQFIDARDLAEWTIRMAESRRFGAFNATGPNGELSFGAMLGDIHAVTGDACEFVEATAEFLGKHKVNAWSDMPVWMSGQGDTAGFHRMRNARAIAAGLTFRPLAATAADILRWFQAQPAMRQATLRAGLDAAREAELLQHLAA